eukprot:EG_transcript_4006
MPWRRCPPLPPPRRLRPLVLVGRAVVVGLLAALLLHTCGRGAAPQVRIARDGVGTATPPPAVSGQNHRVSVTVAAGMDVRQVAWSPRTPASGLRTREEPQSPPARHGGSATRWPRLLWPAAALLAGAAALFAAAIRRPPRKDMAGGAPTLSASIAGRNAARPPPRPATHPRRATRLAAGLDPAALLDPPAVATLAHALQHAPLAAGFGIGCQVQSCGDALYQASLDPGLRLEEGGQAGGAALPAAAAVIGAYLTAKPGVGNGLADLLYFAPKYRRQMRRLDPRAIKMHRKLGEGSFGEVFYATLTHPISGRQEPLVLKRARQFGQAEVWMNQRVSRAVPGVCAEMIDSFETKPTWEERPSALGFGTTGKKELWLAFAYEGDFTLAHYLAQADFPFNLEAAVLGRPLSGPQTVVRRMVTIREIMRQLAGKAAALHGIGIVHRDFKPENCIVRRAGGLAIIDLGSAADLRTGTNYFPREYVLDPRYVGPEMTVMSSSTAAPPPAPLALAFAPVLWALESPDRFDVYSLGVMFLQMCFAKLRSDRELTEFNAALADTYRHDLQAWRDAEERRRRWDFADGFQLLDLDGGAGWELLKAMLRPQPPSRPTAAAVAASRFVTGVPEVHFAPLEGAATAVQAGVRQQFKRLNKASLLSEAQLDDMLAGEWGHNVRGGLSRTLAWWQGCKRAVSVRAARFPRPKVFDWLADRLQTALRRRGRDP